MAYAPLLFSFFFLPPSSFMMLDTTTTTGVVDVGGYKRPPSVVSAVSSTFLYYLTTTIRPVLYGPFLRLDYLVNFVLVVLSIPLSLSISPDIIVKAYILIRLMRAHCCSHQLVH